MILEYTGSFILASGWVGVGIFILVACLAHVAYQLFFHPLARYPGPFLGRLTAFYTLYHAFRADRYWDLYQLHKKYGPVVRYGPNRVSINDVNALEQIYGHKANVQKSSFYTSGYGISLFNSIDKHIHARKRRIMAHAFSEQALREMQPHMLSVVRDWCLAIEGFSSKAKIDEKLEHVQLEKNENTGLTWSLPLNMAKWSSCMTFDTLGEIAFGRTFETCLKPDNRIFFDLLAVNSRIVDITGQMPWIGRNILDHYLRRGTVAERKKQVGFPQDQLKKRVAAGSATTERRDILHFLLNCTDSKTGERYSDYELVSECNLLLGAGTDTTAVALAASFYFLAHHPVVLNRLNREIRSKFADVESVVKGPELDSITYFHACIDEALRLCPPVATCLPREVLPGGIDVVGNYLPAGTIVGVPIYSLHHNDLYFDRPFKFDPGRWLKSADEGSPESEEEDARLERQRRALVPFSTGPRACIGRKVARMELEIAIARALFLFDIRLAPGSENVGIGHFGEYKIRENFIVSREGPVLQFRRRSDV